MVNGTVIDQHSPFPLFLHYVVALIMFLVAAFSIGGNVLTLLVLNSQTKYSQQIKIYRMQLAFSHIISSVATYWMFIVSSLHGNWIFGDIGCSFYGFVQGFCALFSILIAAAIAYNRARSVKALSMAPLNETIRNSIFLWIITFALSSPPLFGWNRYTIDGLGTTCCFDLYSKEFASRAFVVYILLFGFIAPLAVIIISYQRVIVVLLNSAMFRKRSSLQHTSEKIVFHSLNKAVENGANVPRPRFSLLQKLGIIWRERQNFQNLIRPMKTMVLITVCFVCAWLPYAVLAIVVQFLSLNKKMEPYVVAAAGLIAKSYIAFDPIVYVLTDDTFRQRMRSYFYRTDK